MNNMLRALKNKKNNLSNVHPILAKNVQLLENRLRGALGFLKNTTIHKNGQEVKLHHLPWFLFMGSIGSGKTTFLANSNINFILEKKFKQAKNNIPPSDTCDWWVTRDAVLVDVPGRYIAAKEKKISLANKLWENFIALVKKYRGKQGLNGVIVAVSLSELMHKEQRESFFNNLKNRIHELAATFGTHLPFYFVFTKCDLLPGFLDFFRDCGQDELTQIWGISLPYTNELNSLLEIFNERFNGLIKRLNKQLIWRLHQERNPYTKLFIKDFPLQLERMRDAMVDMFTFLNHQQVHYLKGVYLTSATQNHGDNQHLTYPQTVSSHEFEQMLQIMHHPTQPCHAYFIKQFILHALVPPHKAHHNNLNQHPLIYGAIASAILITALFTGIDLLSTQSSPLIGKMALQEINHVNIT